MQNNQQDLDAVFRGGRVVSYRRLLQAMLEAGLAPVLYREYAAKPDMRSILLIRHDVDTDVDAALNMAAIEFSMGIRSTYYLLPPGDHGKKSNYYGRVVFGRIWHRRKLLALARQLVGYGHEVGLNNNFMQLSRITERPVLTHLRAELAWFRSHGIQIFGSASHGSEFAKKNNFVNYEIFKGCTRHRQEVGRSVADGGWVERLHEIDMSELGLSYEAYFLSRDFAYSDNGNSVVMLGPDGYKNENLTLTTDADFRALTTLLKSVRRARCTALVHPDWWRFGTMVTNSSSQDRASIVTDVDKNVTELGEAVPEIVQSKNPSFRKDSPTPEATTHSPEPAHLSATSAYLRGNPLPSSPRQGISMLPFEYIRGLYDTLLEDGKVNFMDFNDLSFPPGHDIQTEAGLVALYKEEYRLWRKKSLSSVDAPKLNLIIQHDSDSAPLETQYLCAFEGELGIKSTTAIFCREIDEEGAICRYGIDFDLLKRLQDEKGMCFTYHCNAGELAGYDEKKIVDVFNEDVEFLRSHGLEINHFSPHGGIAGPSGVNNYSFFYPSFSRHRLIWTHNRFAPSAQRYSDGAWSVRIKRGDVSMDLRRFLITNLLTKDRPLTYRYVVLLHPQYYFAKESSSAEPYFAKNPWLKEYWELYLQGKSAEYWEPLRDALRQSLMNG